MKNYTITVNGNVYDVTVEEQHQLLQQEPEALRLKQELPERYSRLRRKSAML